MKLIDDIVEILSAENSKLSDALFKTKVLLHKIGQKELVPWVNSELNGYSYRDSVPDYRVLHAQVLVNASNGAYQATSQHIPMGHLKDDYRNTLETAKMEQSLAVLEKFAEKNSGHLQAHIPMEAYSLLGKGLGNGYQIEKAWSEISPDSVLQILIQVRSRLLDFVLELKDQFPNELDDSQVKDRIENIDAENLFKSAMFGDNTTIMVGSGNTQTVTNKKLVGDCAALENNLKLVAYQVHLLGN
ncbi:hypothetical protein RGQ13_10405 [Thalassotalea psychrophila]|uniref:AbiTii domain-containing protein n=1 Tax=Thalassotalea psychrophila TaxID=3065647 RepID=A0ABY9TNX1_9GAMM|nr:hypothetical protein RGQ13_10405 [Colwelliaceae bacterium SQ149]